MARKRIRALLLVVLMGLTCLAPAAAASGTTIRLAQQYGMQYAPVYVAQELRADREAPARRGAGVGQAGRRLRDERGADRRQAGRGVHGHSARADRHRQGRGLPHRGGHLRAAGGADGCARDAAKTLADLGPEDRIAVPGVGSIQHIMLSIAAEKELGNANAFDNSIVAMANPDAYTALISGTDIVGHFASMPYLDLEAADGMVSILSAPVKASIVCVTTKALHENAEAEKAILDALNEAIGLINSLDPGALEIIAATEQITPGAGRGIRRVAGHDLRFGSLRRSDAFRFHAEERLHQERDRRRGRLLARRDDRRLDGRLHQERDRGRRRLPVRRDGCRVKLPRILSQRVILAMKPGRLWSRAWVRRLVYFAAFALIWQFLWSLKVFPSIIFPSRPDRGILLP